MALTQIAPSSAMRPMTAPAKIGTEAIGVERCVSCEAMIDAQSIIGASAATQQLGNEAWCGSRIDNSRLIPGLSNVEWRERFVLR
jgi:hypothetical protein